MRLKRIPGQPAWGLQLYRCVCGEAYLIDHHYNIHGDECWWRYTGDGYVHHEDRDCPGCLATRANAECQPEAAEQLSLELALERSLERSLELDTERSPEGEE